jgi:hypothetical protein
METITLANRKPGDRSLRTGNARTENQWARQFDSAPRHHFFSPVTFSPSVDWEVRSYDRDPAQDRRRELPTPNSSLERRQVG